ncbi:MAG TPA: hypothetical protein VMR21_06205 [Vicinamibacteria bacterium]|nr:hypothetical protein [Vicinamibacteria bacterium]
MTAGRLCLLVTLALGALGPAGSWAADPAAPPPSPEPGRVRLSLRGALGGGIQFDQVRTFTEFAEAGRLESRYENGAGPGFEAGLSWRIGRRFAVSAAAGALRRKGTGSFSASLPHPLVFGAAREAEGRFEGSTERETALHLDLAVLASAGRLEWSAFAGPSLIRVDADLVRAVEYAHAYPYDAVTVTGTPLASARGSAAGFNVGAGLDWRVSRRLALGTQARFSRARVTLRPGVDDVVEVDAGGFQVAAGLRVDF